MPYYYLLTSLSPLPSPGASPPYPCDVFLKILAPFKQAQTVLEYIFLKRDLACRQAILSKEIQNSQSSLILTQEQLSGRGDLPEAIFPYRPHTQNGFSFDTLWQQYYEGIASLADSLKCSFLYQFAQFEVTLMNQLATARINKLDMRRSVPMLAPTLHAPCETTNKMISQWQSAPNPLDGYLELLKGKCRWSQTTFSKYTFDLNEVASYGYELCILHDAHLASTRSQGCKRFESK